MKPIHTLILAVSVFSTSCHHIYYSPNTANTPLLTEKKETRINATIGTGEVDGYGESDFTSADFQFAHALTDHVGFMVNGFMAGKTEEDENGKGQYIEIAPGAFTRFSKTSKWMAEIYGGIGTGSVVNNYGMDDSKVSFTKFFVQPAIGFKGKNVEIAFSPKFSHVSWKVKKEPFTNTVYGHPDMEAIKHIPNFIAFEPALIFRVGSENFKIQFGMSLSDAGTEVGDLTGTAVYSAGISLNFRKKK